MSSEPQQPLPMTADTEPQAGRTAVPVWLIVLFFLLLYWGMIYFDQHSGWFNAQVYTPYRSAAELVIYQPPTGGPDLSRGKAVYENICGLCHNNDGSGKPGQAPPFVGSEWALGSPNRMIRIPLADLAGPIRATASRGTSPCPPWAPGCRTTTWPPSSPTSARAGETRPPKSHLSRSRLCAPKSAIAPSPGPRTN